MTIHLKINGIKTLFWFAGCHYYHGVVWFVINTIPIKGISLLHHDTSTTLIKIHQTALLKPQSIDNYINIIFVVHI